ncbi:EamA family transporter [Pseudoroseicyclus aestuarii]|uniref:EamA-like transporter family protein n=1 Tax=Pseudoroseicyclus aestuarii TaxID=1795041 RepID=A0A318SP33_9RHOB|nr:EamA family transporter [Pseudoroseicyclus aestuarii]PYE82574.1 EamA-like transporter family protein [Pseudoroseicyclus aestuarii]
MTVCYATSTVYVPRFVTRAALEMAAGFMLVGTVVTGGPVAVYDADLASIDTTLPSLKATPYLGLVSAAAANLVYFRLVPGLGATRMARVKFAIPKVGTVLGVLILEKAVTPQRLAGLAIILGLVWLGIGAKPAASA